MTKKELKVILDKHNLWLEGREGGVRADLEGAYLIGANLKNTNLEYANLIGTNLIGTNLEGANLYGANLKGATLIDANLEDANLSRANLENVNFIGANLEDAIMSEDFEVEQEDSKMNNLEKLQAARVSYEAAHVSCEDARFSYEAEIEATLTLAVEALGGMIGLFSADNVLRKGTHLNMELSHARNILAELTGETE